MRWANLSRREEVRKKLIDQESEAAIQESGLQLDGDRREQFIKRYGEGRRVIEEQLRKEMNEKRKPLVHELVGRLRNEFASDAPVTVAPQTASPTPTATKP
ncbi:MAG: hypothetical protein WDN28_00235 [Chthoniobacter sp.]